MLNMLKSHLVSALVLVLSTSVLAQMAVFHQEVTWSPDGRSLSYSQMTITMKDGKREMDSDVYIVSADGSKRVRLTSSTANEYFSSWSADGNWIAYGAADNKTSTAQLFLKSIDGKITKKLTNAGGRNSQPAISPDGTQVVFASTRDSDKYQLYVMDIAGGKVRRITNDYQVAHYNPRWSPDGKKIVFYSEIGDSKDQIWTIDADGSDPKLLTGGRGHNIFPAFTPDGRIIFSSNIDGEHKGVFVMSADGESMEQLEFLRSSWARISPDGTKIAWIEGRFPNTSIYVSDLNGKNKKRLAGN